MTRTLGPGHLKQHTTAIPHHLVVQMRPGLPSLAKEIIEEIRHAIPAYGRPIRGPYVQALQIGVERALAHFVDQLADPSAPRQRYEETYRRLGRFEAQEGRTLDSLQASFRIGAQVAWRRLMKVSAKRNLSSSVTAQLADALFAYIDELASLAQEGYLDALPAEELQEHRRRLLRLLLSHPPAPRHAIAELAERAQWDVPGEVTLVAVPRGARVVPTALAKDVLTDFSTGEPHLLVPGRIDTDRRHMLAEALPEGRTVSGLTVPPASAADSLRWARQGLRLVDAGIVGDGPVTRCEDHMMTLWLLADPTLVDHIARRSLAGMAALNAGQRDRLLETLRVWLTTRGTANEIAEELYVHPQTVRYRMRKLENALGDLLTDPDERFAIEMVLRATWLLRQAGGHATEPGGQDAPPAIAAPEALASASVPPPRRQPRPPQRPPHERRRYAADDNAGNGLRNRS